MKLRRFMLSFDAPYTVEGEEARLKFTCDYHGNIRHIEEQACKKEEGYFDRTQFIARPTRPIMRKILATKPGATTELSGQFFDCARCSEDGRSVVVWVPCHGGRHSQKTVYRREFLEAAFEAMSTVFPLINVQRKTYRELIGEQQRRETGEDA